jgi:hypothetical protein
VGATVAMPTQWLSGRMNRLKKKKKKKKKKKITNDQQLQL